MPLLLPQDNNGVDTCGAERGRQTSYRDPDRIVTLSGARTSDTAAGARRPPRDQLAPVSGPDFLDWHGQSSSFEAMAYHRTREASVMRGSTAEYAQVTTVSAEFFRVFAVEPLMGVPDG